MRLAMIRRRHTKAAALLMSAAVSLVLTTDVQAAPASHVAARKAAPEPPPPSHAIPAAGVFDADDLLAIARKSNGGELDAFTENPTNIYAGRDFVVQVIQALPNYDIASHTLSVTHIRLKDWVLESRHTSAKQVEGQNAYGAKTALTIIKDKAVIVRTQPLFADFGRGGDGDRLVARVTMEPEMARETSKHVAWVITGTLVRRQLGASGRNDVVTHDTDTLESSLFAPTEITTEQTVLNAVISKATLLDTLTGKLLYTKEFPTP